MTPFIGQIMMFGGNFAPRGWAFCDGRLLPINQYSALFSILGTTYGGDGVTTFGLPDLRGRVAIHQGRGPGLSDYKLGQKGGSETNTLTTNQLPSHRLSVSIPATTDAGNQNVPSTDSVLASFGTAGPPIASGPYSNGGSNTTLQPFDTNSIGGGQPVDNIQPYLAINFVIALEGVYPSRS